MSTLPSATMAAVMNSFPIIELSGVYRNKDHAIPPMGA
jgi:hypothetical protein